jgi:ABC-type nickel/cobalt efflux system permease component RcnA
MGVWRWISGTALALLLGHLLVVPAAAHPLGNFTVNHHSTLLVSREQIVVEQLLDMAEIPAYQERAVMDRDGAADPSPAEAQAYHQLRCAELLPDLSLRVADRPAPLSLVASAVSFPPGQGGLATLRLSCRYEAEARISGPVAISFADTSGSGRLGWREIVVRGEAVAITGAPNTSVSAELSSYPDDLLSSPLDVRAVAFEARPAAVASAAPAAPALPAMVQQDRFAELLTLSELTPLSVAIALGLAFVWGAAHALAPGHGKTVVAAYLVGSRGTVGHALFLGLTTTITHTAGVFALGLITLFAAQFILPEQLFPWLSLASGLLVVWLGVSMFAGRLRGAHHHHGHGHEHSHDDLHNHDHPHPHSHTPPEGAPLGWRSLLALGVSGGLIPCPSALVVLLGAIALGRVGFGLALVLAFSLGLAGLLTAIGIAFLYAGRLVSRVRVGGPLVRFLPAASALCVAVVGLGITWRALVEMGILR